MAKLFLYQDGRQFYHVLTGNLYAEYPRPVRDFDVVAAMCARDWVIDHAKTEGYVIEFGKEY